MEDAVTLVKHCGIRNDFHQDIIMKINKDSAYGKLVYANAEEVKKAKKPSSKTFGIDPTMFTAGAFITGGTPMPVEATTPVQYPTFDDPLDYNPYADDDN